MVAKLFLTNFPDWGHREFATAEEAIQEGRKASFEFAVFVGPKMVASWTVFGGLRRHAD